MTTSLTHISVKAIDRIANFSYLSFSLILDVPGGFPAYTFISLHASTFVLLHIITISEFSTFFFSGNHFYIVTVFRIHLLSSHHGLQDPLSFLSSRSLGSSLFPALTCCPVPALLSLLAFGFLLYSRWPISAVATDPFFPKVLHVSLV